MEPGLVDVALVDADLFVPDLLDEVLLDEVLLEPLLVERSVAERLVAVFRRAVLPPSECLRGELSAERDALERLDDPASR